MLSLPKDQIPITGGGSSQTLSSPATAQIRNPVSLTVEIQKMPPHALEITYTAGAMRGAARLFLEMMRPLLDVDSSVTLARVLMLATAQTTVASHAFIHDLRPPTLPALLERARKLGEKFEKEVQTHPPLQYTRQHTLLATLYPDDYSLLTQLLNELENFCPNTDKPDARLSIVAMDLKLQVDEIKDGPPASLGSKFVLSFGLGDSEGDSRLLSRLPEHLAARLDHAEGFVVQEWICR